MKEESLIFIISQPRSGSTYLQNVLSNNDIANTASEPWILLQCANFIKPSLVKCTFDNNLTHWAFTNYTASLADTDFDSKKKEFILSLYEPLSRNFRYVIDKTPRYWELIECIPELFPKARIIVLKRNPLDVALSMMRTWELNTLNDLSQFYRDLILAPKVLNLFEKKFGDRENIEILRYEDLKEDTQIIHKLYAWLEIPFSNDCLNTENNTKIRGDFGDPYQNQDRTYSEARKVNSNFQPLTWQRKWLQGYSNFLGSQFLQEYGAYNEEFFSPKKTSVFSYYKIWYSENKTGNMRLNRKLYYYLLNLVYKNK